MQKLEEENERLRKRLLETKQELLSKVKMLNEIESVHRQQMRQLTSENTAISREIRELSVKLTALQAQPPEVLYQIIVHLFRLLVIYPSILDMIDLLKISI